MQHYNNSRFDQVELKKFEKIIRRVLTIILVKLKILFFYFNQLIYDFVSGDN